MRIATTFFTPASCGFKSEEEAMMAFKTKIITFTAAFLIGAGAATPQLALSAKAVTFPCKPSDARVSGVGTPFDRVDQAEGDLDALTGYSPLGIAKINGRRIAIYAFQNGAKPNDAAGQGRGFADVFDNAGHLKRRFIFRENLNSPPKITEFVYMPER
jgi:hypothetical protein